MKYKSVLISIFLLMAGPDSFAQQAQFDSANELLEDQRYQQAIHAYQSIADDGHVSGALWLNMGIAYAHLDSLGKAKYYLMRSQQFKETEDLAKESIEAINNRFSRRSAVLPVLPWEQFLRWAESFFGVSGLMITGLLLLNVGAGFILACWFRPGLKTLFKYLSTVAGALAAVFILLAVYLDYEQSRYATGVTIERQAAVHLRPDQQFAEEAVAYEGYTMRVDLHESESTGNWYYVRLESGRYGWIEKDAVMTF